MVELFEKSRTMIQSVPGTFRRYLHDRIRWNNRLIAVTGARGCGKTTLLLQHAAGLKLSGQSLLYVTMDDLMLRNTRLVDLADIFYKNGGKLLILDEIHKYPGWSVELKNIYDTYKELQVVFTGSSVLEIYKGEADLSRRAIGYHLHNLSLREFIALQDGIELPVFSLQDILKRHTELSSLINKKIRPIAYFNQYVKYGAFPYFTEDRETYLWRLLNTIQVTIETDLPALTSIDYAATVKLKQLASIIAESVPFKPNILKLSERLGIKRDTLVRYLQMLEKGSILALLNSPAKGIGQLTKPDKIYLHNPNLLHALSQQQVNPGTVRETFFINQMLQAHTMHYVEKGDFIVDGKLVFEIGGAGKTTRQIKDTAHSFLALDNIEHGSGKTIPLWIFGFLY